MNKLINWNDPRATPQLVNEYFSELSDMLHELRMLENADVNAILKKYGARAYLVNGMLRVSVSRL